jgi:hypothetical protein
MPKGRKPNLGQVSFRLPPNVHQELIDIAGHLGLDLSSLLNEMIAEALPALLKRATVVANQKTAAREQYQRAVQRFQADSPAVRHIVEVGRTFKGNFREMAMRRAAKDVLGRITSDEKMAEIMAALSVAREVLAREDEERELKEWYGKEEPPAGPESQSKKPRQRGG